MIPEIGPALIGRAALLAQSLDGRPSLQHVVGSLVEFWWLCEERHCALGPVLGRPAEILLAGEDVVELFRIASGGLVADLWQLAALGFVEDRGGGAWLVPGVLP